MERLNFDIEALQSLHRFGDALEDAIKSIQSETAEFEAVRDAKDCVGRHWYGMRCRVACKKSGLPLYLHIGLIYFPSTRPGLMAELDEQNNRSIYHTVLANIEGRKEFEINRDEPEYFKLFMPDDVFTEMSGRNRQEQVQYLRAFVQNAAEAMMEAAGKQGFSITYRQMADALNLADAFDRALTEAAGEISTVTVNYGDKDNFGQYAQGFRYYLKDKEDTISLYAYFGAIYSYKKQPAGIFAEVDWFSNQDAFQKVFDHMKPSLEYELSVKEPKFVKLFLREADVKRLNETDYDTQIEILKGFLKSCNDAMIRAAKLGGSK